MIHPPHIINKGWDKDLLSVIETATSNSLNKMSYDQRWKLNRLIVELKDASIWQNTGGIWVTACDEGTTSSNNIHIRKINLIDKTLLSNVNSNNFTITANQGIKGDNGLGTGIAWNVFPQKSQDSAGFWCYCFDNNQSSPIIGQVTTHSCTFNPRNTSDQVAVRLSNTTAVLVSNTNATGFWHCHRTSSSTIDIYKDGSAWSTGISSTSAAATNNAVCLNQAISTGSNKNTNNTWGIVGIGGPLNGKESDLYTIVMRYLNSL